MADDPDLAEIQRLYRELDALHIAWRHTPQSTALMAEIRALVDRWKAKRGDEMVIVSDLCQSPR